MFHLRFTTNRPLLLCAALLASAACALAVGCSRSKARIRADNEVNCLVDQKSSIAGSLPGQFRIGITPESRMHDSDDPDCPPMPPDDPLSHRYMECVDSKKGAKCWRCAERTPFVENPNWRAFLPLDKQGRLVLDSESAVRLGLLHDPQYQSELEELYLSALDVTFERFRFDAQLFGGADVDFIADGRVRSGTSESSSLLSVSPSSPGNRWRIQKLTATGGELVVGLANTLVWQFSGPNNYSSATLLDFSIVQPLLRGGGRIRVMERLTLAERTLLANVRAMERFRREYYLNVVTGRFTGPGPVRRGGLLGGAGLANFAGVGLGIGGDGGGGFSGGGIAGAAGAASAGGYLGLLQTEQVLKNQRANVAGLRSSTAQLEASYDAGRIDRFQVDLARQALYNAQSQLLIAETSYQDTLDAYKIELGLPPDLVIVPQDQILRQFDLLDPQLTDLQDQAADLLEVMRTSNIKNLDQSAPKPLPGVVEALAAPETLDAPASEETREKFDRILLAAEAQLGVVQNDLAMLKQVAPERRSHMQELSQREELVETQIDPQLFAPSRFDARLAQIEIDFAKWTTRFAQLVERLDQVNAPTETTYRLALTRLSGELLELSILQARIRLDAIDLSPTELTAEQALEIARVNRRDWANARASLVDSWRLIHFNANDLESAVDLVFSGDIGNTGDNPFSLNSTNGRLRVGVEFDSPTSRLAERNVYRQSLIEYQQARRSYYRFVDRVHQGLRSTLRQVRLNEINLELRREAVFVAIAQVDLTQLRLSEPPKPGDTDQFNNTTARDLVQALGDLLSVQNDLLSVWVNNRVQRLSLELDLGVMLLDSSGLRVEMDQPLHELIQMSPCQPGGDVQLLEPNSVL